MSTPSRSKTAVHIVTYNHAHLIDACLRPLRDLKVEVCVIDNASSDDTAERVRQAGYPCIVNHENRGYAAAHNQAIRQTSSEYILTLNPDVVLQPGFIAALEQALDANPEVGSAAACLLRVEALDVAPVAIDGVGLYMRRNRRQGLLCDGEPLANRPTEPRTILGPDGAAAFYRRAMLEDIAVDGEIFDEDFFIHKEDVDICWRALLRGWQALYVPQAVGWHIRSFRPGRREHVSAFLRLCAVRNRYLLLLKNEDPALFRRDFFHIITYDIAILGYLLLRERSSLRALGSAWALRRKMLAKRRQIQARRRVSSAQLAPFMGHAQDA